MISNLSLSAFSGTDLRPTPAPQGATVRAASERAPVGAAQGVSRVRAQSETRPAQQTLQLGPTPPSGKPPPRGSLLDLSV